MAITERHVALWAKAHEITRPARDDSERPTQLPRRKPGRKAAIRAVDESLDVEPDAPEIRVAVR